MKIISLQLSSKKKCSPHFASNNKIIFVKIYSMQWIAGGDFIKEVDICELFHPMAESLRDM